MLHPREVAKQLNLREFILLCDYLDCNYGEKVAAQESVLLHGTGAKLGVAERTKQVRFNILEVRRSAAGKLKILIDFGLGEAPKFFDMDADTAA